MALVLYLVTALAILLVWDRCIAPVPRFAAIVLILLPLLALGRALLTDRIAAPADLSFQERPLKDYAPDFGIGEPHERALSDLHAQILPWHRAVRHSLANGQWPLWNPFILCGDILAAAAQPSVYDPLQWIGMLVPIADAFTFNVTMTFFLAGFFAWAFARSLGISEIASFVAAAGFAFCGMFAFFAGWPLGRAWAYLPLVLFATRRLIRDGRWGLLTIAFVLLIVSGHPESILHVVTIGAAYGAFELAFVRRWRAIALAGLAGVVALLLTAVYLLPFLEAVPQTHETYIRRELYAPASYDALVKPAVRLDRIRSTFVPGFRGEEPTTARVGPIVLALALIGIGHAIRRQENRRVIAFFALLALVCLLATFGTWPIAHGLHALPLFDITLNERLAFAAAFSLALLAAFGVDAIAQKPAIGAILLAIVLVQRVAEDGSFYPALPRETFFPRVPLIAAIPRDARMTAQGFAFIGNNPTMYGLEDVRGYEAMTFRRLFETYPLWSKDQRAYFNRVDDLSRPFLSFLNVRYAIGEGDPPPGWLTLREDRGMRLFENLHVLPRAFVPRRIRYEQGGSRVLESMQRESDFFDVAWIEAPEYPPHEIANGPGSVTVRRFGLAYELDASMDNDGWMVVSATAWKGWRARIDGHRVGPRFANHAFLGVFLPKGTHRVTLDYLPRSFTIGRNISLATLAVIAALFFGRIARMPAIFLYLPVAIALIALWHRTIQPIRTAAAIVLVLLPLCFTGRAMLTGRVYGPIDLPYMSEPLLDYATDHGLTRRDTGHARVHNGTLSDLYMQMMPWQAAVRASWSRGEWPLWNPYMLCGSMLAANMQSAPYDPLQVLALILPQPQAMTFGAAMTFFLAGLFFFAFARSLGLGDTPALIGAAGYMCSEIIAFFVGWPLGRAWAIFPLLLTGARLVVRETSLRAAVVLTTAFVMILIVGHPESVLHIVFAGVAYGAFEVIGTRRWKSVGLAAICGVLALLLTAIALLPFFEAAPQTAEYMTRHEYYKTKSLPVTSKDVLRRAGLSVLAWYGGHAEHDNPTPEWEPTNLRTGAIVLALAAAALVLARRQRETWFFFGTAFFCGWVGLNAWPLADWLHRVPLFDITINDRLSFVAVFALAMLAALAAEHWPSTQKEALRAAAVVFAIALALGITAANVFDSRIALGVKPGSITLLTLSIFIPLTVLLMLLLQRTQARIALPIVLGLLLLQRNLEDGRIYPTLPESMFYPTTPILEYMQNDRSGEPFRMAAMHFMFLPDAAALYGLEDARGYEAMTFLRLAQTYPLWSVYGVASYNNVGDKAKSMLSMLNIKYLIAYPNETPNEQWKPVLKDRNAQLLENQLVLPRAYIPRRVRYEKSKDPIIFGMSQQTDWGDIAWIEAPEYTPHEIGNGRGTLKTQRSGRTWDIRATMLEDGWIVLSESAWSGWRAYVDGKRVNTKFANHAFLGIYVPKGMHDVRVVFQPEGFTRGRTITLLTIAGLIAYFALHRYRRKQPRAVSV